MWVQLYGIVNHAGIAVKHCQSCGYRIVNHVGSAVQFQARENFTENGQVHVGHSQSIRYSIVIETNISTLIFNFLTDF